MTKSIEEIKYELRRLWKQNNELNKIVEATEREQKRLTWLIRIKADKAEIEATERNIAILEGQDYRKGTAQLKNTYLQAFEKLSPIEKTIMTDKYINHKAIWRIADDVGYDDEYLRHRIGKIIKKVGQIINS